MKEIVSRLLAVFCCGILLICSACGVDDPVITQTAAPTQTETAATPTGEPMSEWAGSGYTYASEKLGIAVEFPPEWEELFYIEEKTVADWLSVCGESRDADCVVLVPKFVSESMPVQGEGLDMNIGYIYWVPQEGQGPEAHTGEGVCLTSSDDGKWVCWLNTMMQTAYSDQRDSAEWRTYYTVQSGILDGEYKITLAPPDAPDTINEISTG